MGMMKNKLVEFIENNESELMDDFIKEQNLENDFNNFCEERFASFEADKSDEAYERMREDQMDLN